MAELLDHHLSEMPSPENRVLQQRPSAAICVILGFSRLWMARGSLCNIDKVKKTSIFNLVL
jgi:hypothetical protein